MRRPLRVRIRLLGTAFFSWLAYRSAPAEIRPFMLASLAMANSMDETDKGRTWGVLTAGWSHDDLDDRLLAQEMSARVGHAAKKIRAELEEREIRSGIWRVAAANCGL